MERRNGSRWKANEKKNFSLNVSEICRHLSRHEYIYIYICTFTAVHYCLSISKAWLSPHDRAHDSIRNSELRNECALPHSRPPDILTLEKRFHNRTLARMNLPALVADISRPRDIRYSIEICVSAAGDMEEADEKTRSKGQRKRKREGEGEICWLLLASWYGFAHLFQSGFSSVDGRFSTFTKEWFPAKVFKSRPKMRIRVARNFEARPTFLIFGFLIFAAFRLFLSLFLCLRTNATRGVCIFVKIDPC